MTDIGADIATAIAGHLKALRYLNRTETSVGAVAAALGLPDAIVERAFSEFKLPGKLVANRKRGRVKSTMEYTPVVSLTKRRAR